MDNQLFRYIPVDDDSIKVIKFSDLPDETYEKCQLAIIMLNEIRNLFGHTSSNACLYASILCGELAAIAETFCDEENYDEICDVFKISIKKNIGFDFTSGKYYS